MPLGVYVSIPFCRSKCSFCNFASGVFSREKMNGYVARVQQEITGAESLAVSFGATFDRQVDSIYLGGGTPTTLAPDQLSGIFKAIHNEFDVQPGAEITVECAPGTLGPEILDSLLESGTNRVSLGTQSFVNAEINSVGRLHTAEQTIADIAQLQAAGINNINVDLIAGLPHQTAASWRASLERLAQSAVPHASVYMLEIDEDSRLGRELIAGGNRYHAHYVPDSDRTADFYLEAIEFLGGAGLPQYEISNFSREGFESRHNMKYWMRQPYLGFGLDAHSMLPSQEPSSDVESVRFSNPDELQEYVAGLWKPDPTRINSHSADEEAMFLGLRLNRGIDLADTDPNIVKRFSEEIRELCDLQLLEESENILRLTTRGRLLSNEVFERFVATELVAEL